jgi:hypothetical protein
MGCLSNSLAFSRLTRTKRAQIDKIVYHLISPQLKNWYPPPPFLQGFPKRQRLLAIQEPELEYKPLPANSLAAFKEAIDRRLDYRQSEEPVN